jgi:hypothetical protein
MAKQNCWEFKKCGREPGGAKTHELGVCPAATFALANGFCGGKNGGRACVYITGTFCAGVIQGTYKEKQKNCADCEFYKKLKQEHGAKMSVWSFYEYVKKKDPTIDYKP